MLASKTGTEHKEADLSTSLAGWSKCITSKPLSVVSPKITRVCIDEMSTFTHTSRKSLKEIFKSSHSKHSVKTHFKNY